ncbi:hypothetical protein D5Z81_22095 [Escherichia coli]|nr:hypothetical protein [Escherichia coli]EEW8170696.1 hypothetical protein [Escherichia coli]EFB1560606.1 hypothetical protein [Escherichia coli]EFB7577322.1 hypothetical protein [Escherichia coli]EFC4503202.1 hypothetical protein [Escherichia coli]
MLSNVCYFFFCCFLYFVVWVNNYSDPVIIFIAKSMASPVLISWITVFEGFRLIICSCNSPDEY